MLTSKAGDAVVSPQHRLWVVACVGLALVAISGPAAEVLNGKKAVEPVAPPLPSEVVGALQEARFAEAIKGLDAFSHDPKTKDDSRAYAALVGGVARRLAGQLDDARTILSDAIKADPKGRWAAKLRSELAAVEIAAGQFERAENLAASEAQSLLDDGRKDRLAAVYRSFADRLLKPESPTIAPNPEAAHALLEQGRNLAKGSALRAELLAAMARASTSAKNPGRAIAEFQLYLSEYPQGADRFAVRFDLGEVQLTAGQANPARTSWLDLARDLEKVDTKDAQNLRARALYGVARTYGMPTPGNDSNLNLGVAALRRVVDAYPGQAIAVRAAYEIGSAYLSRGKSQEALNALTPFIASADKNEGDDARKVRAELVMAALFQTGQILQGQEKFNETIAAFRSYLNRFPNGPQSADAQRSVLDTRLQIAADLLRREQYADARAAWHAFATENPLDPRIPQILFQIAESYVVEEKYDDAFSAWEALAARFPGTEPAAHGLFSIASIFETEKGDPAEAIERFKKVTVDPWQSQARQRIAVMEAKALTVVTPRVFRSGENAHLKIASRNLEKLTFTAYKLSAEAYFRKKHNLDGVESLDIGLVAPDAEWSIEVPGYARYKPIETTYDLKNVKLPGVYVVKVTDEKTLQATTLVLGSDLDAIVKTSREQILVFAQDMKTGEGRAGARVLVAEDGAVVLDAKTGTDGVLLKTWDKPRSGQALSYLVLDGPDAAGTGLNQVNKVAQGLTPRAYIYTDRPAYRPGQSVGLRGVVREVADSQYANPARTVYRLEVTDSRGRPFVSRPVTLSAFGTFHESLSLDDSAPIGTYRVRLYQPGKSDFAGAFEVQSYKLEKADLDIELPRAVYFRGEPIQGKVVARYQYGTPIAQRPIRLALPDGRTLQGTTDAAGTFAFELETVGFAEEQTLRFSAFLPEENVAATALVNLAVRAFRVDLSTPRDVYLDGETFRVSVTTVDVQGLPIGQAVTVALLKRVQRLGRFTEKEVTRVDLKTDPKTGSGAVSLKTDDPDGGSYIVRVAGTDRLGNPVVADRTLTISGTKDETRLRILTEQQVFKVGENASVRLHSRGAGGTALLTWEADRIIRYQVLQLKEGENPVTWPVEDAQFPNFTLDAARMIDSRFDRASLDLKVERDLRVTIAPARPIVGPGDEIAVDVTTRDQLGRPVAAEVSLAMVDRALFRLYQDRLPPIGPFFYGQTRTGAFATGASNTFRYQPVSVPVAEAVVEEAERLAAAAAEVERLGEVREEATKEIAQNIAPAAPMAAAPAPEADAAGLGFGTDKRAGLVVRHAIPKSMPQSFARGNAALGKDALNDRLRDDHLEGFDEKKAREPAAPRQSFAETAYWNPSVVTDKDGTARITFRAPSALSQYRITARGVTGSDTLAGETTADLAVRKDLFVDLKTPASLTQGDQPRLTARLHHAGVTGKARLTLKGYPGDLADVRDLDLRGDGVVEVTFDPFIVPDTDHLGLELSVDVGEAHDSVKADVPVRPWGAQAFASASGTSADDATAFVSLPAGRAYEDEEMAIVLSPTVRRLLVELALGRQLGPIDRRASICIPVPPDTLADRASDLLACASALVFLRSTGGAEAPEAVRLADRIRGLVAELVTRQNNDGGWPWTGGASDRSASARAAWALASAEPLGLVPDVNALNRAVTYLNQQFAAADPADHDTRAAMLHALSTRHAASFEAANALNRARIGLSDVALAYLSLTFAELNRPSLASEVLDVLAPRAKTESSGPGLPERSYWEGSGANPWHRGPIEATALASFAFARSRPDAPLAKKSADWLLAHRLGNGWQPGKAKGPALAALTAHYARSTSTGLDRYRLLIRVNDEKVFEADVDGKAEGQTIAVPRRLLKIAGGKNRVAFDIEGRGTFGYAVTLTGFTRDFAPDQDRHDRPFTIDRRNYWAPAPVLDGRTLATGFGVAVNASTFENTITQLPVGARTSISIEASRHVGNSRQPWERDFLILEEHLPAGTTLVEGSIRSQAGHHTYADGVLTLYFAPDQWPGCVYDVFGYLPGAYRALPPTLSSAYEPGRRHLGPAGALKVLTPSEKPGDPYRPTPDELYARGKALFDSGRSAEAVAPLESLWSAYTLRNDVARDAARMLLAIHIGLDQPKKIVQYFEVLKEKAPDLVLPFDQIRAIGRAYGAIGEHERAYLVWRATAEASYLEDARVGEVLRQHGRSLESVGFLLDLWREYPNTASIEADFFGLAQVVAGLARLSTSDPAVRRELTAAKVARSDLLLQSIRLFQVFLSLSPRGPMADEASLGLVGSFLELEDYPAVVRLARRFGSLYPKSPFFDSFQYAEALGRFHLGEYDRAIEVADAIASATYKDANGVMQASPNKWQALYILGQIYDARRRPARAAEYYHRVADRFSDAADAERDLTRKDLKLPEVSILRPTHVDPPGPRRAPVEPAESDAPKPAYPDRVELSFRNIAEVDLKVYPVDLMRLYLTRRSLDGIAGIDLAGVTPRFETRIKLGDGADFRDRIKPLTLPIDEEGAYLVMVRGDDLYASGVALVSPLEMDVREEPAAGRVRVTVRDAKTHEFIPKVLVKVIGTGNRAFFGGETDLRGVFVAEGVVGQVTAVARRGAGQYAFYRGSSNTSTVPPVPAVALPGLLTQPGGGQSLEENLRMLNCTNQDRQLERLKQRYSRPDNAPQGVQVEGVR